MQRTLKILGLSALFSLLLQAQSTFYPFYFHSFYKGGYKSSDDSTGVYYDYKNCGHLFKAGYEYKITQYTNNTNYDNYQHDFIVSYSRFISPRLLMDATAHLTLSDLAQADTNQAYLLALSYVQKKQFHIGIDVDFAKFNKHSLTDSLWQFSPNLSLWYGEHGSRLGELLLKLTYNYSHPQGKNIALNNHYSSTELSIQHFTQSFTNVFAFSFGKSLYLLKDKGFTFYNNNEIHTQGMIFSSAYKINNFSSVKLSYIHELYDAYDPLLNSATSIQDAKMGRLVLSASWKF